MSENFKILIKNQLPDSEVEIEGEISPEAIERERKAALEKLNQRMELSGFRKGHIPEKILTDRVGELGVLEEAASLSLENLYLEIIKAADVNPVGRPQVTITKLAVGNPLGFKIKMAVVPEVKLPNYKKLAKEVMAKEKEKVEVTNEEFEEVLKKIKKPENIAEDQFKNEIRQHLLEEKQLRAREKRRLEVMEKIIDGTKITLPKVLIESEKEKMLSQFKVSIESMGIKTEDYFKQIGKTEEEMKTEWQGEAEKRAKMELILQKISLEEKIEPPKEKVEKEIKHLLSHHKNIDPLYGRIYVEQVLTNQKVWEFLESQ